MGRTVTNEEIIALAVDKLAHDGDTVDIGDGKSLRLRVEPDYDSRVEDDEWYGKIEWAYRGRYHDYAPRPDGFDGNAEVILLDYSASLWWQPPADGPKRGTPEFQALRSDLRDLIEYGYNILIVERCEGKDAYGRPIVQDFTALGGVAAFTVDLSEYVGELVGELLDNRDHVG